MTASLDPRHREDASFTDYTLGDVIGGRYRVVRHIGGGAMGDVFEVEHLALPKRFALKALQRRLAGHEELVHRFRREAEVGALLHGENLVSVTDCQTGEGLPFFVMELLEGED